MASTTEQLMDMKKKIDEAATEKARLEGSLAERMKRLKELGFDDVASAEKRLKELRAKIAELDEKVQKGVRELREEYGL